MSNPRSETPRDVRVDVRLKHAAETGTFPRDLCLCGPAGTGKTFGVLSFLHCLAADYPDLRILTCRQTRVSLSESVCVTLETSIFPADGMEHLTDGPTRWFRRAYTYPNGSVMVLGGLDRPAKVMSTSWDIIYINEAIETTDVAYDALSTRLNRPDRPSCFGWLLTDTNPGPPGHWLKTRCDEGRITYWDTTHRANPELYRDGDWTEAGRLYRSRLEKLTGAARARLLDGQWVASEGLVFGDVLECVTDDVPEYVFEGRHVGGIDFGWNHPFVALDGYLHDDILWVTGERYKSFATLPTHSEALPRGVEWWADPSRPESIAELQLADHTVNSAVHYGTSPVQEGIDQVCHRARTGRLRISRDCVNLIRECGTYSYGTDGKPGKVDDHAPDALRYLVRGIDRGRAVTRPRVAEAVEAVEARKAEEAARKRATFADPENPYWWGEE